MLLSSCYFSGDHMEGVACAMCEQTIKEVYLRLDEIIDQLVDPNLNLAERFPKYWKKLPPNWQAIDTYRVNKLFPVVGDDSGMILHARKKLLVPGVRTGGKTLTTDIAEAHATLGGWLADNKDLK